MKKKEASNKVEEKRVKKKSMEIKEVCENQRQRSMQEAAMKQRWEGGM